MPTGNCLSERELSAYVVGHLDPGLLAKVDHHLEDCEVCQNTVVMLAERSDTFVDDLRNPVAVDSMELEAEGWLARQYALRAEHPVAPAAAPEQIGPYRIVGRVGAGGMGTVYTAVHPKLKRTVALKILPRSRWTNAAAVATTQRCDQVIYLVGEGSLPWRKPVYWSPQF